MEMIILLTIGIFFGIALIGGLLSLKQVEQTERGVIERFGKYNRFAKPGLNFIIPFVEKVRTVNITEMMVDAQQQEIITKDKLNAIVDAQIYFKVKEDEESIKNCMYKVYNYKYQIVNLARTTLRNIIGTLSLNEANSDRNSINSELMKTLSVETKTWGIEVVRAELKEINPPKDVQDTMNQVVKAENEKQSAIDFATALETKADGQRRAQIKEAEGFKQASILRAEGDKQSVMLNAEAQSEAIKLMAQANAESIKITNEAANKYFKGDAQLLKKLQTVEAAMANGTKYVIDSKSNITNIIGDLAGLKGNKND